METRIKIIGSSHISKESVKEVQEEFKNFNPQIIAVELDSTRIKSLFEKKQEKQNFSEIRKAYGIKGASIITFLSYIQRKLGKIVKTDPGSEMREAVTIAKKNNLQLELIDQPIEITLHHLSKAIKFRVIMRMIKDVITAPFKRHPQIKIDLNKVPDDATIDLMISEVKKQYPEIHKALIDDRNRYMAKNLFKLYKDNPDKKILVVVGAGHKKEMIQLLKKYEIEN